jgi:hypothetical protein
MKQEFEMQQSEMDEILRINREVKSMPVMMIGSCQTGGEKREAVNDYWRTLGRKYNFDWETVEGSSKGKLFFLATPIPPPPPPKTQTEIEIDKYLDGVDFNSLYSGTRRAIQKIVDQLEKCEYESQGRFLKNNIAFRALKQMATK